MASVSELESPESEIHAERNSREKLIGKFGLEPGLEGWETGTVRGTH